jgi:hypothetical protein
MTKEEARRRIKNFDAIIKNRPGPYKLVIKKGRLYHDGGMYCNNPLRHQSFDFVYNSMIPEHHTKNNPGSDLVILTATDEIVIKKEDLIYG